MELADQLIDGAQAAADPIDVFCSNAGVTGAGGGPKASDAEGWLGRMRSFMREARSETQTSDIGAT